jgi:hypothetical protein
MVTAKQYRAKSNACSEFSKETLDPDQIRKYRDSSDSFGSLADNEDWLAGNLDKTLQAAEDKPPGQGSLAAE